MTPLERPSDLSDQETLNVEDAAAWEARERTRRNRDLFDPERGALFYRPRTEGGVLSYNEFWYERGVEMTADKRTSLIVDPPSGRRPPRGERSPEEQAAAQMRAAYRREHMYDSYENRSTGDRCLMGFNAGPPMTSATYNNNAMIFQAPGYVAILNEMVHNARIIPLDGSGHSEVPLWTGVSRGHWEGETLVVETKNFLRETSFQNSSNKMHLVERFERMDDNTLLYTFTVTDPSTWTEPWTVELPMRQSDLPIYEYACHEGNYGMPGTLSGARAIEQEIGQ